MYLFFHSEVAGFMRVVFFLLLAINSDNSTVFADEWLLCESKCSFDHSVSLLALLACWSETERHSVLP